VAGDPYEIEGQGVYAYMVLQTSAEIEKILQGGKIAEGVTSNLGDTSTLADPDVAQRILAGSLTSVDFFTRLAHHHLSARQRSALW